MGDPKTELVRSWLVKAQHDLGSAKRLASEPNPYLDTAVYHCQQAAEKALKAYLVQHGVAFEKTHNLVMLIDLCAKVEPDFKSLLDLAANLAPFATAYRYPDEFFEEEPEKEQFTEALRQSEHIMDFVTKRLPKEVRH